MLYQRKHVALLAFIEQSDGIKLSETQLLAEVIKIVAFYLNRLGRREYFTKLPALSKRAGKKYLSDLLRKKSSYCLLRNQNRNIFL